MDMGKQYEVIKPNWAGQTFLGGGLSLFFLFLFFLIPGIITKIIFGILLGCSGFLLYNGISLRRAGIWFYENGIVVKQPYKGTAQIELSKIDNYNWDAQEISETEHGVIYDSTDVNHNITLQISYEDDHGKFQEVDWTCQFPSGSIQRLQRATERANDAFHEIEEQDDFYDE